MVKTELLNCLREEQKHNTLKKVSNINLLYTCNFSARCYTCSSLCSFTPYFIEMSFLMHGASALATSLSLKQPAHDPM